MFIPFWFLAILALALLVSIPNLAKNFFGLLLIIGGAYLGFWIFVILLGLVIINRAAIVDFLNGIFAFGLLVVAVYVVRFLWADERVKKRLQSFATDFLLVYLPYAIAAALVLLFLSYVIGGDIVWPSVIIGIIISPIIFLKWKEIDKFFQRYIYWKTRK